jgi:hypothetical protein
MLMSKLVPEAPPAQVTAIERTNGRERPEYVEAEVRGEDRKRRKAS